MQRNLILSFILSLLFVLQTLNAQQLYINEVMSSNSHTITDEDGDYPDWIELYNGGDSPLNLNGFSLSDDADQLDKWQFPDMSLESAGHLLVFASGKDRTNIVRWWETVLDQGDLCRYKVIHSPFSTNWKTVGFNDEDWLTGPTGLGYGDGDDATIVDKAVCVYVRQTFEVANPADVLSMILQIDFDDAFVAYLNGVEVARANIGQVGLPPAFDDYPDEPREAEMYQGGDPLKFDLSAFQTQLLPGNNILAIEVHNNGIGSSDLSLIPFLSLGFNEKPAQGQGINPILELPLSGLHSNFKIKSSGEALYLSDADGTVVDQSEADSIPGDVSKGRFPDGTDNWYFFNQPTPAKENLDNGYEQFSSKVTFSMSGGMYNSFFFVSLSVENKAKIYYTTDGSAPTEESTLYTFPIHIDKTLVVRARAFLDNALPGPLGIETFFVNENLHLPVISLATDPANLWDEDTGIYVLGKNASADFPYFGANFWQDWEKPAEIEFYDENGNKEFAKNCGIKIFGSYSRGLPQKSLAFFFRGIYGASQLDYPLLPQTAIQSYESFVMRNSGNDWLVTMFRDGLMQTLVANVDLDKHGFRPALLFINGQYWGIQNIREKINEHYLSGHYGFAEDQIDMLEYDGQIIHGDNESYQQLIDYISTHNMNTPSAENYILNHLDLDEYLDYEIAEIYFDNTDWPGNNIKFWRPKTEDGKWRWILYDTDFGFGLFDQQGYKHNTLDFALDENGPDWPNPPWSTLLFRKILENETFKTEFIRRFQDHLNITFGVARVKDKIAVLQNIYLPEIDRHLVRWEGNRSQWDSEVERLNLFAEQRVPYMRRYIQEQFGLGSYQLLKINLQGRKSGDIKLNGHLNIGSSSYCYYTTGQYLTLKADAEPGFKFAGWSGDLFSDEAEIHFPFTEQMQLTAQFVPVPDDSLRVVLNEINYNSASSFDSGDWIELVNAGTEDVDLCGWVFKDSDASHHFNFPNNFVLPQDSFVVVVKDENLFHSRFPNVSNYLSGMDFGLSGSGELLRLYDDKNQMVDSVEYDDKDPWPEAADGMGMTLELLNPGRDNSLVENWDASAGHGTPGKKNSVFTGIPDIWNKTTPQNCTLEQNYPNPFNPETKIRYSVTASGRSAGKVRLSVYNILGQTVRALVDEIQNPGFYTVSFSGMELPSGVYFYRLETGDFLQIRKMILIH